MNQDNKTALNNTIALATLFYIKTPTGLALMPASAAEIRVHDMMALNCDPANITMRTLLDVIKIYYGNSGFNVETIQVATPLESTDYNRTLADWVCNPTEFQRAKQVDSQNKMYRENRNCYGKLAVNVICNPKDN